MQKLWKRASLLGRRALTLLGPSGPFLKRTYAHAHKPTHTHTCAHTRTQYIHLHACRGGSKDELLQVLSAPSAREKATLDYFKSNGAPAITEHCPYLTREECFRRQCDTLNNLNDARGVLLGAGSKDLACLAYST
eukprot:1161282-Pelagomonas_calceolata.AAC.11